MSQAKSLTKSSSIKKNTERRIRELSVLAEMNAQIHSTMNLNRLLQILVEKAVVAVNFERCLVYLLEGDFLRCAAWIDRIKTEKASIIRKRVGFRMDERAAETLSVMNKVPLYVKNAVTDPRVSPKFRKISDTKEYCVVPLLGRNRVLGIFTGDKAYSSERITKEDMNALKLFVGHIALAIDNSLLYEEREKVTHLLESKVSKRTAQLQDTNIKLSKTIGELSTLYKMSQLLNNSLRIDAVCENIADMLKELGYDIFALFVKRDGKPPKVLTSGLDNSYEQFRDIPLINTAFQEIAGNTPPVSIIKDLSSAPVERSFRDYCFNRQIISCLEAPIIAGFKSIGSLRIYSKAYHRFSDDSRKFFSAFTQQAGIALDNAIKYQDVLAEKNHIKCISEQIQLQNKYLKERIRSDFVIGSSPGMHAAMDLVNRVANTDTSVIIYGETGTGKELIANAVHELSIRKENPLIKVNCAAIPEELIESELFGHEKGSFTGAHQKRIGMFQLADGGSIFLDEIGELSQRTQTKLLRVLQEHEIMPLGSKTSQKINVRVIAATNKDLPKKVREHAFRSDLFYRLNVFPITLPPLRERKQDIPELAEFFARKYAYIKGVKLNITQYLMDYFLNYSWPGNVRELENAIERLSIISNNDKQLIDNLPTEIFQHSDRREEIFNEDYHNFTNVLPDFKRNLVFSDVVRDFKRYLVLRCLEQTGGKKSQAANLLSLPRSNFSRLLKSLEIEN
ncbi:MAG TPA: sigma 54-interacting transcriptional regulator [Desulfobacteraceae bacterium]|nr:sigma 54-interacting transcriptional regulator [Desulfobacteraceae bacterium]HPJ66813.1 sigma 54-interacting transcriptional regulator [Desulfobacteraceae bacterium]HPQ27023.1 sigma 54-interacting transcriptional regulator [Desulfobacteraceae bacterium]